ncbi:MAG: fused MFS/spermidine synthase, partial [Planctomycetes bacterium]|nr:fused MFS/spermidine synthase [Planctomycetota bacterium]
MYSFRDRVVPNLVVFLSGLAIMLVELVASRLVAKHLGSSLETWTTVIGVILAGMSLGSYWGGRLSDLRDPLRTLPLLLGGSALLCVSLLVSNDLIGGSLGTSGLPQMVRIVGTIGIMLFPPAFVLGTIQPTVARWAIHHASRTGSAIGNIGAWATIGNILGTFLTGFVLLIEFGVQSIVSTSAALLAVTALAMWLLSSGAEPITSDRSRSAPSRTSQGSDAAPDDWWLRAVPNAFVFVSGMSI